MKDKKKKSPTPPQRLFKDEFRRGDRVSVIRTAHGWFDGCLEATYISPGLVRDDDGIEHEIDHPRDIRKS